MATYKDIEPIINDFADRIMLLKTDYKDWPLANKTEMDFTEIVLTLKNAPTADVQEVKPGHWIDHSDKIDARYKRHDFICSICNNRADNFVGGTGDWWCNCKPNFCPNCGAKMFGGSDEE